MTDPYVLYYPPTNSHPFLFVSFSADGELEAKLFATEEEAETLILEEMGLRSLGVRAGCLPASDMMQASDANKATQ